MKAPVAPTKDGPRTNREIRAREVHLHLSDPNHRLLVGSLVHARFSAALDANLLAAENPATVTLVPKTAVLSTGVRHVAWRVSGKKDDGRLTFALAALALGLLGARRPAARSWLALAAFSLVISLGPAHNPLYLLLFEAIPGFWPMPRIPNLPAVPLVPVPVAEILTLTLVADAAPFGSERWIVVNAETP